MAKKNFKGGLDSLIENSLGIKKSRKGEMKGNPVDFIKPEQTDDDDEVLAKPRTPKKPAPIINSEDTKKTEAVPEAITETTTEIITEAITERTEAKETTPKTNEDTITVAEDNTQTVDNQATAAPIETVAAPEETTSAAPVETTPAAPVETPVETTAATEQPKQIISVSLDKSDDDSTTITYLKDVIGDLRHELFLWRNGTINVQTFNATLHTHGLKYNPVNNEIEEFDAI